MGKQALEAQWNKVLKNTREFSRANIDKYTQIYIVNVNTIKAEVYKALNTLLPTGTQIPSSVDRHCSAYCRQLYLRYSYLAKAGRAASVTYDITGSSTNFVVSISSINTTKAQRAQVMRKLNDVRTQKTTSVMESSRQSLNLKSKDLNADKSPLGLLRYNIIKSVFDINIDKIDWSQDSKILDVILGYRHKDKKSGKFTAIRHTGLLHFGHLEGFAVVEQRAANIISKVASSDVQINIGSAFLEKYLTGRNRVGDILGGFNINIDLSKAKVAAGMDEFNLENMGKEAERALLKTLREEFFTKGAEWADVHGSSSIRERGSESLTVSVEDAITAAFAPVKKTKAVAFKPARNSNKKLGKESTKTKPKDLKATARIRTHTESIDSHIPSSMAGTKKTTQAPTAPQNNWASILPILNTKLPISVISNMVYPSLINRTGTFAYSTKIINVETTKEGYPSFVYDYERNPYNVFDRTAGRAPWNTPERDPRTIIDKSIRDLVRDMAIGRFYTRRA